MLGAQDFHPLQWCKLDELAGEGEPGSLIMARITAAAIGGALLGILAMLAVARYAPVSNRSQGEAVRDLLDVPAMAQSVAEKHRVERYDNLTSVGEVISLPSEFARSEAMYAIAGRSSPAGVQNLIFDVNRIADDVERASLLNILFFRLAETDPRSALALARTDHFQSVKSIEQIVWHTWARKDLDDALFAAKTQTSLTHQNSAAQSLYAAFGFMGNDTTERIEAELGIAPDRSSRVRFLHQLADQSPVEAITFINSLPRSINQQEYISWLANHLSLSDPHAALGYANLFVVASDTKTFSNIINSNIARENPRATIERMLTTERSDRSSGEYQSAIRALASTDLDAAMQYFEQARSAEDRQQLGSMIAAELAKNDPDDALSWARANDREPYPLLQMSVLLQIAVMDPQLAWTEALKTPNAQLRSNLLSNVVQIVARNDPATAATYLNQIRDPQQKIRASRQLASAWIRQDPDAAIDWILGQGKQTSTAIIQQAGNDLLRRDIDAAIQLLPRIDEQNQANLRQRIAQKLAAERSPTEAQSFIRQFAGQPDYAQLQASVISGVARTDTLLARQLADQLSDGSARDTAYVEIISQRAKTDPLDAARWLGNVHDELLRGAATGQLARNWYEYDSAAAMRWVSNLPPGSSRDDALVQMSRQWGESSAAQNDLIASIEDHDKRSQAKIRQIYKVMRTNPAKARRLMEDEDITSDQRKQIELMMRQYGSRY